LQCDHVIFDSPLLPFVLIADIVERLFDAALEILALGGFCGG
jgi:hypothetical protein